MEILLSNNCQFGSNKVTKSLYRFGHFLCQHRPNWCSPGHVDLCVLSTPEVQFLLTGPFCIGCSHGLLSLACVLFSTRMSIPQAYSSTASVAAFAYKSFLLSRLSQFVYPALLCLCQILSLSLEVFRVGGKINYDWAHVEFGCRNLVLLFFLGLFLKHWGLWGSKPFLKGQGTPLRPQSILAPPLAQT